MRAPEAVEPLMQLASNEDTEPFLNKKAIEALGRIGDARAVPVLMRMLTKERQGISFYVESSFALYQVGAPAADAVHRGLEGRDAALTKWAQDHGVHPASYAMKGAQILGDLRDPARRRRCCSSSWPSRTRTRAIQALVRMQAADALGRMRAPAAVTPLSALVTEEDPTVRASYVRALVLLGGREALPALEKAAAKGDWYAREVAMRGIALLGDAREQPLLREVGAGRARAHGHRVPEYGGEGCENPAALGKKRAETVAPLRQGAGGGEGVRRGWRLLGAEAGRRGHAAGGAGGAGAGALRRGPQHAAALAGRLSEKDVEARFTLIQSLDWLVGLEGGGRARCARRCRSFRPSSPTRRATPRFVKVNEDLRRLVTRLEKILRAPRHARTSPTPTWSLSSCMKRSNAYARAGLQGLDLGLDAPIEGADRSP